MQELDQFYTKPEVAKYCISKVSFNGCDVILEPSAGNGSFFNLLPKNKRIGIDISSKSDSIIEMNFFDFKPEKDRTYYVIGNPPFGRISSTAVKFFNHASSFADYIAFIIPRTFKRISVQNRLDLNFHLVYTEDIPIGSFVPESMQAKCCFQIWKKKNYKRSMIKLPLTHKDFTFIHMDDKLNADFAIHAYGSNCGEISFDIKNLSKKSWHFIKAEKKSVKELIDRFSVLDYSVSKDTVRQDSIGRAELVWLYSN